jgi:hypothetical protein
MLFDVVNLARRLAAPPQHEHRSIPDPGAALQGQASIGRQARPCAEPGEAKPRVRNDASGAPTTSCFRARWATRSSPAALKRKDALVVRLARTLGPVAPIPRVFREMLIAKPEGPDKLATILCDLAARLAVMGRYERRA